MMTKKIIIVAGMWGVGKSHSCEKFIKDNPEYKLIPANQDINEHIKQIKKHDYVITDYYFFYDWNAEKLKKEVNCDVDILVLFDRPEEIIYRQIFKKENIGNVSCQCSNDLYLKNLRELLYMPDCTFIEISTNTILIGIMSYKTLNFYYQNGVVWSFLKIYFQTSYI